MNKVKCVIWLVIVASLPLIVPVAMLLLFLQGVSNATR